jgi:hypothetical protein
LGGGLTIAGARLRLRIALGDVFLLFAGTWLLIAGAIRIFAIASTFLAIAFLIVAVALFVLAIADTLFAIALFILAIAGFASARRATAVRAAAIMEAQVSEASESTVADGVVRRFILSAGVARGELIETDEATLTAVSHQLHLLLITRFKANRSGGRNVQMEAERQSSVELEVTIYLKEMKVRAHLNGTIAGVAHLNLHGGAMQIVLDGRSGQEYAAHSHSRLMTLFGVGWGSHDRFV